MKSSSELNLNTSNISTSVPIRSTRTSRLRAAAASGSESSTPRKGNRSSSVTSLVEDTKTKTYRNSKIIERDKLKKSPTTRQNHEEKENLKSSSTSCFNDIGAIKSKPKHSINKSTLEKEKGKNVVSSLASYKKDAHNYTDEKKSRNNLKCNPSAINGIERNGEVEQFDKFAQVEPSLCNAHKDLRLNDKVTELSNVKCSTVASSNVENRLPGLKYNDSNHNDSYQNVTNTQMKHDSDSVVPTSQEIESGGLLGVVCVRKVERFSELLSNLCSPYEAELLFEDILADNEGNRDELVSTL